MSFCSHCGIMVGEEYDACPKCDGSLAPTATNESERYGGFWIRLAATLIDGLILGLAISMEFALIWMTGTGHDRPFRVVLSCVAFALTCLSYEALLTKSTWRGTVGKRVLGLTVTDKLGYTLSLNRSIGRCFAKSLLVWVSFIVFAFRHHKRGLHDLLAGTEVTRGRRSRPMAVWSMILGILSLFLSILTGVPAIIMGHLSRANRNGKGELRDDGEARAGLILGYASIAILLLLVVMLPNVPLQSTTTTAAVVADPVGDLRTLNTAIRTYKAVFHAYPPSLQALGPKSPQKKDDSVASGLVDSFLASGLKNGYLYTTAVRGKAGNFRISS